MTSITPPSGHDVYWEKWKDAFDIAEEKLNDLLKSGEEEEEEEDLFSSSSYEDENAYGEENMEQPFIPSVRSVMTPFGILPVNDDTLASRQFKFWVGHSNFRLTEEYFSVIGGVAGVETLDILTPYRFRIGIGRLFTDRNVMNDVRSGMLEHVADDEAPKEDENV